MRIVLNTATSFYTKDFYFWTDLSHYQCLALHSLCLSLTLQAQYVFVHDSLSELVMCGETEVGATNFRIKMNTLRKPIAGDPSGATGFQKQFEVAT